MKLGQLMQGKTPKGDYAGFATNDDYILAVDISGAPNTHPDDYEVAEMGIVGLDARLNPERQEKQYIRAGKSSAKTGTQRTFHITGERYLGDPFQDFALSPAIKYGTGQAVVVPYVFFNFLSGKGEKGTASIIVHSDAGGNSGENAGVQIDLEKTGGMPQEYTYAKKTV